MDTKGFHCQQCGRCCELIGIEYHISLTPEDIDRWIAEGRDDILKYVDPAAFSDKDVMFIFFPVAPDTGQELQGPCPFLKRLPEQDMAICQIHATKPACCRAFPISWKEAAGIECPAAEATKDEGIASA
jgi:Fe-S-cluster containining protein